VPDLRAGGAVARVRVGRWDRVAAAGGGPVDVDAQDLAEQAGAVLRVAVRVAGAAAVADREVQVAVGSEGELAAVVVGELAVADVHHHRLGGGRDDPGARVGAEA
jgi:hypothetical protein